LQPPETPLITTLFFDLIEAAELPPRCSIRLFRRHSPGPILFGLQFEMSVEFSGQLGLEFPSAEERF
jgi:hypothetical protein